MFDYKGWSDTELITACREGSEEAWNTLVERYSSLVYTIPRRYGCTSSEVEDVFQSVWLLLLQHLDTIKQPERLSAWLVTSTKRQTWNLRRGATYDQVDAMTPELLRSLCDLDGLTVDELLQQYERHQALHRALQEVDERCRRLLYLLYFEEPQPSYEEIAQQLDLALGSIGPIRARCLKRLAAILKR